MIGSIFSKHFHIPALELLSVPRDPAPDEENFEISHELSRTIDALYDLHGENISNKTEKLAHLRSELAALSSLSRKKNDYEFRMQFNLDLNIINALIHAYNTALTTEEKQIYLHDIKEKQRLVDMKYPDYLINQCDAYQHAYYDLSLHCQLQEKLLAPPVTRPLMAWMISKIGCWVIN